MPPQLAIASCERIRRIPIKNIHFKLQPLNRDATNHSLQILGSQLSRPKLSKERQPQLVEPMWEQRNHLSDSKAATLTPAFPTQEGRGLRMSVPLVWLDLSTFMLRYLTPKSHLHQVKNMGAIDIYAYPIMRRIFTPLDTENLTHRAVKAPSLSDANSSTTARDRRIFSASRQSDASKMWKASY
jgi:hypothetical protein